VSAPKPKARACANCGRKEIKGHKLVLHADQWWCPGACELKKSQGGKVGGEVGGPKSVCGLN